MAAWTVHSLFQSPENAFFLPGIGVAVSALSLALLGVAIGRQAIHAPSVLLIAAVFVVQNVFIVPAHVALLFLFVTVSAFVMLLDRQRSFFADIFGSLKGEGEMLRATTSAARNSVATLAAVCASAYVLCVLLFTISIESTYGLTSIWSALFFASLLLLSVLVLSLLPR